MTAVIKSFHELSNTELYEILRLRSIVFVVEQKCAYNDIDNLDQEAIHLMLVENNSLTGYARMLKPGVRFKECSIGRVVVHPDFRGRSCGRQIMTEAEVYIKEYWHTGQIAISAQDHLRNFYESLDYKPASEVYFEDNIPHIKMIKQS